MAKITVLFALMLIALGLVGYVGTGSDHPTALIPTWIGLILGLFGALSFSSDPGKRKLYMHINVTVALLAFIGSMAEIVRGRFHAVATGIAPSLPPSSPSGRSPACCWSTSGSACAPSSPPAAKDWCKRVRNGQPHAWRWNDNARRAWTPRQGNPRCG